MTDDITQNDCQGEDEFMAFYTKLSPLEKQLFKAIGIPFQLQDFGRNILEEDGEYFEQTSEQMDRFTEANKIALSKVMSIVRAEIARLQAELNEAMETLRRIADQRLFEEMTEEEQDDACFSDGYDEFIRRARAFLTKGETDA